MCSTVYEYTWEEKGATNERFTASVATTKYETVVGPHTEAWMRIDFGNGRKVNMRSDMEYIFDNLNFFDSQIVARLDAPGTFVFGYKRVTKPFSRSSSSPKWLLQHYDVGNTLKITSWENNREDVVKNRETDNLVFPDTNFVLRRMNFDMYDDNPFDERFNAFGELLSVPIDTSNALPNLAEALLRWRLKRLVGKGSLWRLKLEERMERKRAEDPVKKCVACAIESVKGCIEFGFAPPVERAPKRQRVEV